MHVNLFDSAAKPEFASERRRAGGWKKSRPTAIAAAASKMMESEAVRLSARAWQARIASEYASEAGTKRLLEEAAVIFDARARALEELVSAREF